MATIVDVDECRLAGVALTGDPAKDFPAGQPPGGHSDFYGEDTRIHDLLTASVRQIMKKKVVWYGRLWGGPRAP